MSEEKPETCLYCGEPKGAHLPLHKSLACPKGYNWWTHDYRPALRRDATREVLCEAAQHVERIAELKAALGEARSDAAKVPMARQQRDDWKARAEKAERERTEALKARDESDEWASRTERIIEEKDALEKALREYGAHSHLCAMNQGPWKPGPCNCGFDAALAGEKP